MEEADSLLGQLEQPQRENADQDENEAAAGGYSKHPKDDKTVMEELQTVNSQLRALITKLVQELDTSRREVESLRSKLKLYEGEALPDLAPLELPSFDFSHL